MKMFTSDGLLYVYKTYKIIKLYWHVSFYNNIIIVIQTDMSVVTTLDFSIIILVSSLSILEVLHYSVEVGARK